jgi:hypothetical protein
MIISNSETHSDMVHGVHISRLHFGEVLLKTKWLGVQNGSTLYQATVRPQWIYFYEHFIVIGVFTHCQWLWVLGLVLKSSNIILQCIFNYLCINYSVCGLSIHILFLFSLFIIHWVHWTFVSPCVVTYKSMCDSSFHLCLILTTEKRCWGFHLVMCCKHFWTSNMCCGN